MDLLNSEQKIITLILLLTDEGNKCNINSICEFYKDELKETVLFLIQNLKRKKFISIKNDVIELNEESKNIMRKYYSLSCLFGRKKSYTYKAKTIDSNVIRATVNLMINDTIPIREANLHHVNKSGKLKKVFPSLYNADNNFFFIIRKFLLDSRSVYIQHLKYIPDFSNCSFVFSLTALQLLIYISKIYLGENADLIVKNVIKMLSENPVSEAGLLKIIDLMIIKYTNEEKKITNREILNFLIDMKAVGQIEDGYYVNSTLQIKEQEGQSICDSDLCITYSDKLDKKDKLYLFADVEKCDEVNIYHITKDSFSRAIELNMTLEEITNYINNSSVYSILSSWNESLNRVKIYEGITVKCTDYIYRIITEIPTIKKEILQDLGNGIIVLKSSNFETWNKTLSQALDLKTPLVPFSEKIFNSGYKLDNYASSYPEYISLNEENLTKKNDNNISDMNNGLTNGRDELCKYFNYGPVENVSGMDYAGKISLIKQSVKEKNSVLLIENSTEKKFTCHPLEIIKTEDSGSLVRICILPDGEEIIISISGIYRITKFLKNS